MKAMDLNQKQFEELLAQEKPILVDYWASWCGYCRRIAPAYDRVAEQYGDEIIVAKINIDENPQLAEAERIEVIPTLVLYRKGQALGDVVAPSSKADIDAFIARTLQ